MSTKVRNMKFSYEDGLISQSEIFETAEKLKPEIRNLADSVSGGYEDDNASINLPDDKDMLGKVKQVINEKLQLKPKYLIVVGIGGSNLGAMAVQEAVLGKLYNQLSPAVKVLYADTVDSDLINAIAKIIEPTLAKEDNVILNVISKLGATTETIANFTVLADLLRRHRNGEYAKYVVATCDKGSELWELALEEGFSLLEIPEKVGGRYSVFSPVGLFPLGFLGINLGRLLEGARSMRDACINMEAEKNPAAIAAAIQYLHHKRGRSISDLFLFSNDLESVGKWFRQLMAESLGKEYNKKGEKVNCGITPTVSIGSTDLHSMAQLYLGGPHDKFTTFVRVEKSNSRVDVPRLRDYSQLVSGIQGKSLDEIMDAILEGTKRAFRADRRPFVETTLPDKSEYSMGQFLQFKMMETVYLAYLLDVNPYDQPNVEGYKEETRKILAGKI